MKQYYCLLHKRWIDADKLKSKCLKNKKRGAKFKKCKHLIIMKEVKNDNI